MTTLSTSIDVVDISDGVVTKSSEGERTIVTEDAADLPLLTLDPVYGESVQDGTPTPDEPVYIEKVAYYNQLERLQNTGSITVATSNGLTWTYDYETDTHRVYGTCTNTTSSNWGLGSLSGIYRYKNHKPMYPGDRLHGSVMIVSSDGAVSVSDLVGKFYIGINSTNVNNTVYGVLYPNAGLEGITSTAKVTIPQNHKPGAGLTSGFLGITPFLNNKSVDFKFKITVGYGVGVDKYTYVPDNCIGLVSSTGSITYLDMTDPSTGEPVELHGLKDPSGNWTEYRDILNIDASGHVTVDKRTFKFKSGDIVWSNYGTNPKSNGNLGLVSSSIKIQTGNMNVAGYPVPLSSFLKGVTKNVWDGNGNYEISGTTSNYPHQIYCSVNASKYPTVVDFNTACSTGDLKDEYIITGLYKDYWHTIDLGYVDLPEVTDGSTVYVAAEVQPIIEGTWWTQAGESAGRAHIDQIEARKALGDLSASYELRFPITSANATIQVNLYKNGTLCKDEVYWEGRYTTDGNTWNSWAAATGTTSINSKNLSVSTTNGHVQTIEISIWSDSSKGRLLTSDTVTLVPGLDTRISGVEGVATDAKNYAVAKFATISSISNGAVTASCTNFKLYNGAQIVLFANSYAMNYNGTVTVNVNGTGAKTLFINSNDGTSTSDRIIWGTSAIMILQYGTGGWMLKSITNDYYAYSTTASSTVAKVATLSKGPVDSTTGGQSDFIIVRGTKLTVRFEHANTAANPTLNLNSSGAIAIRDGAEPLDGLYNWYDNDIVEFVFTGSQWALASNGSARIATDTGQSAFLHPNDDMTQGVRIGTYQYNSISETGVSIVYGSKLRAYYGSSIFLFGNTNGGNSSSVTYPYTKIAAGEIGQYFSANQFTKLDSNGVTIQSSSGYYTRQNSSGLEIVNNSASVALFTSTARVGKTNSSRFLMNADSLQAYNSSNQKYFEVSANEMTYGNKTVVTTDNVGNVNLLRCSGTMLGGSDSNGNNNSVVDGGRGGASTKQVETTTAWSGPHIKLGQALTRAGAKIGDTYTLSIWLSTNSTTEVTTPNIYLYRVIEASSTVGINGETGRTTTANIVSGKWIRLWCTFAVTEYSLTTTTARFEFQSTTTYKQIWATPLLTKGNVLADWSPAPEDLESEVSTLKTDYSSFKTSVNQFESSVGTTYATKTELSKVPGFKYLNSSYTNGLSTVLGWAAEGASAGWNVESTENVRVGDTVYIKTVPSDNNGKPVYCIVTVTTVNSSTRVTGVSHGYMDAGIQTRLSTAETNITQNSNQIALRATKTEVYQSAQPNLTPFFSSHNADGTYPIGGEGGYWQVTNDKAYNRSHVTALDDGWAHLILTVATHHEFAPPRVESLTQGDKVTMLIEWRNASYTGSGSTSYNRNYPDNTQLPTGWGWSYGPNMNSESGSARYYFTVGAADGTKTWNALINFTFISADSSSTWVGDVRVSFYLGEYEGPYKPYSGSQLYATQSELKVTADGISSEVSKKVGSSEIISKINQSAESVKISASKVNIEGAAIFQSGGALAKVVKSTQNEWYSSTSPTSLAGGFWGTTQPSVTAGRYIWQRQYVTYSDGSNEYKPSSNGVCTQGQTDLSAYSTTSQANQLYDSKGAATSAVNSLEIGGRNLLRKTALARSAEATTYGVWFILIPTYDFKLELDEGEYVLSFDWEADSVLPDSFGVWIGYGNGGDGQADMPDSLPGCPYGKNESSGHVERKITWPDANDTYPYFACRPIRARVNDSLNGITFIIKNAKLEKGNKATDWTPAPEDVNAEIEQSVAGQGGFTILWNYESFTTANNGEAYICALDPTTGTKSDANGWVMWNGVKRTITKQMINPNAIAPYNIPIYIVCRLSSATATTGTNYIVWYNSGWKYASLPTPSAVGGTWTWADVTDIVLGMFVEPGSEQAYTDCTIFNPPFSSKQITTDTVTARSANAAAAAAQTTANNAAPKTDAIKRTQRIYYQSNSISAPSTPGTASSNWVTSTSSSANVWTTKRMSYASATPYIWTCEQKETVSGTVSYTTVLLDDTTTVIDGGKIITGSVTANQIAANSITTNKMTVTDMTNYCQLNRNTAAEYGWTVVEDSSNPNTPWFQRNTLARDNYTSEWFDCKGGESFRVSMSVSSNVTGATTSGGSGGTYMNINFGVHIQTASGRNSWPVGTIVMSSSSATETYAERVVTIPSDAVRFRAFIQISGFTPFAGTLKVRKPVITKMTNADLIVDGSITAGKIATGAISIGSVTNLQTTLDGKQPSGDYATKTQAQGYASTAETNASKVASNYLYADGNGLRIASASPSSQYQRIQLTNSRIDFYNSSNVSVGAIAGSVARFGELSGTYVNIDGDNSRVDIYKKSGSAAMLKARYADTITLYGGNGASGSAPYMELGSSSLIFYDSASTQRIKLNSSDGAIIGKPTQGRVQITDAGVTIYDSSNKKRQQTTSSGVELFDTDGSTSVALFGATTRVGKEASPHVLVDTSNIKFYANASTVVGHIGLSTYDNTTYNSEMKMSSLYMYSGDNDTWIGSSAVYTGNSSATRSSYLKFYTTGSEASTELGCGESTYGEYGKLKLTATKATLDAMTVEIGYYSSPANRVFATPNGQQGMATLRALVAADIPSLGAGKITSGTFDTARIPDLGAGKITSGSLAAARLGNVAKYVETTISYSIDTNLVNTAVKSSAISVASGYKIIGVVRFTTGANTVVPYNVNYDATNKTVTLSVRKVTSGALSSATATVGVLCVPS